MPSTVYLEHTHWPFRRAGRLEDQYEYRMTKWVHDHLPGQRVLASGSVRFWFDAWFDNPQPDGGSAQGMLNPTIPAATWEIEAGNRGDLAVLWLQALGTDAVIVPGQTSLDQYRDFAAPGKFRNVAPVLFDDGHGTLVYGIPRRSTSIGRVVETTKIAGIGSLQTGADLDRLTRYVAAVESGEAPVPVTWNGFDEMEVSATVQKGQAVLVQETYDPAWHAYENGQALPVRVEPGMGFLLIDTGEGSHRIRVRFETPLENRFGQVCFVFGLLALGVPAYLKKWPAVRTGPRSHSGRAL